MTQMDLLSYPTQPGFKERNGTSQEAAEKVAGKAKVIKAKIYLALRRHGPMTPDECAEMLGEDIRNVRPRFSEMKGTILRKTSQRRKNKDQNNQWVWEVIEDQSALSTTSTDVLASSDAA